MLEKLIHLSMLAHDQSLERGVSAPAERPEFGHLNMGVAQGTPFFDGTVGASRRPLRPDQVEEVISRLEGIVGRARAKNTYEEVRRYMAAFGRFGIRRTDAAESLGMSEKSVRRAMTRLEDEGYVHVRLERTRGDGTPRRRFYWTDGQIQREETTHHEGLHTLTDIVARDDVGVRHHGTPMQSVTCACVRCHYAFEAWLVGEAETAERRAGGTGFKAGLDLRTRRRQAWEQQVRDAAV